MIRRMNENDIDAVLELKAGEFQPAWNRDMLMSELKDNPFAQAYVLTKNDKIIGFLDFWITFETAQLANIAIETNRQRLRYRSMSIMALSKHPYGKDIMRMDVMPI